MQRDSFFASSGQADYGGGGASQFFWRKPLKSFLLQALLFLWTWNPIQSNGDILGFLTISEKHFTLLKKPKLKLKFCSERLLMRKLMKILTTMAYIKS
ncbi:hypothetical protein CY35_06G080400 [Sphagnum magellanicum]|nr:hypothetical protein CY35_06G080400 [Sphagnum magellanicum]